MAEYEIREAREEDAEALLKLQKTLDSETRFMLLEPGERDVTWNQIRDEITRTRAQENSLLLVAESGGELVGFLGAFGGRYRRNRHRALVVVGVLQKFVGRGIGTRLFEELEDWARLNNIHRLELTVMEHNKPGIALYRKMGFDIEGTRKDSLLVDGYYVDEYTMAKIVEP
jgi:RimJ/RimL family protein N-acetyltransferase